MISTLRRTSRRFSQHAPVPCMHSAYYDLLTTALHDVTRATTLAKLMYAAPAWWGFARAVDRARIDSFIRRTCRMGYLSRETPEAAVLVDDAEDGLLAAVASCSAHVLRPIFPPLIARRPGLRPRPHDFTLPDKVDKNFISRVLYRSLLH